MQTKNYEISRTLLTWVLYCPYLVSVYHIAPSTLSNKIVFQYNNTEETIFNIKNLFFFIFFFINILIHQIIKITDG